MTVRVVTDSNAMLPASLVERFAVTVVALTIVVDCVEHREVDLDPTDFCARLRAGAEVTTAAPSPGEIIAGYRDAIADGANELLSIHIGSNQSATVAAARLAAGSVDVPVTIVDTGTASFIEGCCVWRAAELIEEGADVGAAADAARAVAAAAGSVFTIGEIARAAAGGRLPVSTGAGVTVYGSSGPDMRELGKVATIEEAIAAITATVAEQPGPLRVGVGDADADGAAVALLAALSALPQVAETIRYTVGPSVAAHTGAGTFGAVYTPLAL